MTLHVLRGGWWQIVCPPSGAFCNIQKGLHHWSSKKPDASIKLSSLVNPVTHGKFYASSRGFTWYCPQSWGINLVALFVLLRVHQFIQSCWMLPFSKSPPLILPSRFSVSKMIDSIARLRSWLVSLFTSIGLKHVLRCSFLNSSNVASNTLSSTFFIPFVKLYVWANIWPNTVASSVV